MTYKKNTFRRAAAAAAAICLAFAFAFAEETGADKLGFGTSVTASAADLVYYTRTNAKLFYTIDSISNTVTITKAETGSEPYIDIPSTIDGGTVSFFKADAFSSCDTVEGIALPDSITHISGDIFKDCTSLKNIFLYEKTSVYNGVIPEGTAKITYTNDSSTGGIAIVDGVDNGQTDIDIPEFICDKKVTSIQQLAFQSYFDAVKSITLPNGITSIGMNAFSGCSSLTGIVIPDSVTELGGNAFANCTALESITLSPNITAINQGTFFKCSALKSVDIPSKATSIGDYAFTDCISLADVTVPDSVTSFGICAFQNCHVLKSIKIPDGVTIIEKSTFESCASISEITLPDGITRINSYAFNDCSALKSINIPDGVTDIENDAFSNCSSLETITLPTSVTSIGSFAFSGCTSLKTAFLPQYVTYNYYNSLSSDALNIFYAKNNSAGDMTVTKVVAEDRTSIEIPETVVGGTVTIIGNGAFTSCYDAEEIKLPQTVTEIYSRAFYNCDELKGIDIPKNVYRIEPNAFENCSSLETVLIPSGVTSLGADSFKGCTKLKTVYLPEGLDGSVINNQAARIYYTINSSGTESTVEKVEAGRQTDIVIPETISGAAVNIIGKEAFSSNLGLRSVTLPDGVISIGEEAFLNCYYLTSINIPDSVETIGIYAFDNCKRLASIDLPHNEDLFIGAGAFSGCKSLESIVIPDNIISIEKDLFLNCEKLRSVTLPDGVISIGDYAFFRCSALVSLNFPADLETIGDYAFSGCHSLASIELPNKLSAIGQNAFGNCSELTSVTVPDSVTELGIGAFECCYKLADVTLSNGLTALNSSVLRCTDIKSIVIPESVTQIGDGAFEICVKLESVELPPNVSFVGEWVFVDCPALKNVFYTAKSDISNAYVPATSAKAKYEIRNNLAYILEVAPDSSNTPVVINDTICGYEVMSTAEEYRQYVSETGHTHKGGTATCTEQALCAICGTSYNSTDPSNHDADTNTWEYDENGHWNPCLRTDCKEHLNAAAHDLDDGVVTTEPTDTADGVKTYTCKVCGYKKTETVSKLGHTPSAEWTYDSENHWKICTTEGCSEKLETAAHTFDDGVVTTEPTDTSEGVKTYTCAVCGYKKTESIEKLPLKPEEVIYPIAISGDVTADKPSASAGETVNVSAPFGYDIIVADNDGNVIAKISERGSFTMPASRVTVTAVRGEVFVHMSNAWSHSYVYSYDSDMNRIKVNSDTRRGIITIDLGVDYAGRSFTLYSGRKSTSKKIISGTLDENGRYTFNADEGKNYTLVIE